MGKRKKAADSKKNQAKSKPRASRHFTYSLPVHFNLQFTFRESQIVWPDEPEPEISEDAIAELEQELSEFLGGEYKISDLSVLDGGLGTVFLGQTD